MFCKGSNLVDESTDEVDETTLQLGQIVRFVPVHHGLKERKRKRERAHVF